MKLSWLPVTQFKQIISEQLSLDSLCEGAASLGLNGVDASSIFFRGQGSLKPDSCRRAAESQGLRVAVYNTYADFTNPDAHVRNEEFEAFRTDVHNATAAGALMMRITDGQAHPGLDRNTGTELAIEGLTRAAEIADKAGIRAVYENHSKPGVWSYADFSHPADIYVEIAERLRDVPIGLLFDTANADAREDDPLWILERVIDRVECVHIADTATRGAVDPTVIGTGVVDFEPIIRLLRAADYDGWFSFEEGSGRADGINLAMDFFDSLYNS